MGTKSDQFSDPDEWINVLIASDLIRPDWNDCYRMVRFEHFGSAQSMLEIDQTRKIVQKTNRGVANGGMAETEARGAAEGIVGGEQEVAGLKVITDPDH